MHRSKQDVVGERCIKNDAGELSLSDEEKMKAWVEHYARLLHVEFEWPSDLLPEAVPVEGPALPVILDIIYKGLCKMKRGKAAGPSGVIAEILKASGEGDITMLRHLTAKAPSEGLGRELYHKPVQGQRRCPRLRQLSGSQAYRSSYEVDGARSAPDPTSGISSGQCLYGCLLLLGT
jgi:hypothetical protein